MNHLNDYFDISLSGSRHCSRRKYEKDAVTYGIVKQGTDYKAKEATVQ